MRRIIKKNFLSRPLFFCSVFLLPFFAIYCSRFYSPPEIPFYDGESVVLTGRVNGKDLSTDGHINSLYIEGSPNFKCYVSSISPEYNAIAIGDRVNISGKVKYFRKARNPGEFDAAQYYETRGYLFSLSAENVAIIERKMFSIKELFFLIRKKSCDTVDAYFPIEHGTVNTILFGNKSDLEEERKALYKTAGLSHFLVISGLHVSVAGGGIYAAFRRLGIKRNPAAFISILFILFYGCMVGFGISVSRAVIMYIIRLIADVLKRSYDLLTALSLSCVSILFINPLYIRDSAFLYSYGAVFFVGIYMTFMRPRLEKKYFFSLNDNHGIKYIFAKIKISVAPLVILYFGLLPINLYFQSYSNLLSIPLNLLLGFLTAPILFCGIAGFIFGLLGLTVPAGICDFFCALLFKTIDFFSALVSNISFTKIIYKPSFPHIILYYALFIIFFFILPEFLPTAAKFILLYALVQILLISHGSTVYITVLDVEQGDCIVIKNGPHSAIISDCGSTGRSKISENILVPYLLSQGITIIEDIYVSHGDDDHMNGLEWFLDNAAANHIRINRIIFPDLPAKMWNNNLLSIKKAAERNGIGTAAISRRDIIYYTNINICCLSPDEKSLSGDSNTDSLVLWLQKDSFDALLTGDATFHTEENLVLPNNINFELLKVAHHGSRYSTSEEFLRHTLPLVSVISVGASNNYGHPHPDTLYRLSNIGSNIFRSDKSGAITIIPSKNGITVEEYIR